MQREQSGDQSEQTALLRIFSADQAQPEGSEFRLEVAREKLLPVARELAARAARLLAVTALPAMQSGEAVAVRYHFAVGEVRLTLAYPADEGLAASLAGIFPSAARREREIAAAHSLRPAVERGDE